MLKEIIHILLDGRSDHIAADLGGELLLILPLGHPDDWVDCFLNLGVEYLSDEHGQVMG